MSAFQLPIFFLFLIDSIILIPLLYKFYQIRQFSEFFSFRSFLDKKDKQRWAPESKLRHDLWFRKTVRFEYDSEFRTLECLDNVGILETLITSRESFDRY